LRGGRRWLGGSDGIGAGQHGVAGVGICRLAGGADSAGRSDVYIATANKSNSAYLAIDAALEDVRSGRTLPVPEHLRDTHYAGANGSDTAKATNTRTTIPDILSRRIISEQTDVITNRPNRRGKENQGAGREWRAD